MASPEFNKVPEPEPTVVPKALPPAPAAKTEVTGNLALGLEEGITPTDLYDARVEEMITTRFGKLDEAQFEALFAAAPVHPEYESYCRAVKLEVGGDDVDWEFGRDEPFLDMVGLHSWAFSRQQLRDRLALGELPAKDTSKAPSIACPAVHPSQLPKATAGVHPSQLPTASKSSPVAKPPATSPALAAPVAKPPGPATSPAHAAPVAMPSGTTSPELAAPVAKPPGPTTSTAHAAPVETPSDTATSPAQAAPATPAVPAQPTSILRRSVAFVESPTVVPAAASPEASKAPSLATVEASPEASPPPPPPEPKSTAVPPPPSALSNQVDAITDKVKEDNGPNSVTHRPEYMAYLRAARNPSKMSKELIPMFRSDQKLDLFRIWLQKGKDFARCAVEIRRRNLQSQSSKSKDSCMNRQQLETCGKYTKDDVDDLIRRKTMAGQYISDPNFPTREDLRQYIIHQETSAEVARTREDSQDVTSRVDVDNTEALAVTEEGCDFADNTGPTIHGLMSEGGVGVGEPVVTGDRGGKGGRHGRVPKGRGRGRGKGGDGDQSRETPDPDKLPTPLAKATALKSKVLLISLTVVGSVRTPYFLFTYIYTCIYIYISIIYLSIDRSIYLQIKNESLYTYI